jgi:ribulose kinase
VCKAVKLAILQSGIDSNSVHSIAFTATCSLTVFSHDTNEPISVTGPNFDGSDHNVVLWMDSRAYDEAKMINETGHELLKYLGGGVSLLMELPKVLWFKRNMPVRLFDRCKFYDLNDALAHIATGPNSFPCTPACGRDLLPLGIDGTVKGWQREFLEVVGLGDLADDDFKRVGGVCKVKCSLSDISWLISLAAWKVSTCRSSSGEALRDSCSRPCYTN